MKNIKKISIIAAPSNLGLKPSADGSLSGVSELPRRLFENRIQERLNAEFQTEIPVPPYIRLKDKLTNVLNPNGIVKFSLNLANEVETAIKNNCFPLVLGGDCSILLGNLLALKRIGGRCGLFFMDGHADFYLPEQSETGGVAGMDLAFAVGRGTNLLSDIEGHKPLVLEEDVVLFGFRDEKEAERLRMPKLSETKIHQFGLSLIRKIGVEKSANKGLEIFKGNQLDGFWIHIDADVLDDRIMPAVDARQPDGLTYEEFIAALKIMLASGQVVGMHVGILDPEMDKDGSVVKNFTDAIVKSLR